MTRMTRIGASRPGLFESWSFTVVLFLLISRRNGKNNGLLAGIPFLPPPSCRISRPNSLPFQTPARQAKLGNEQLTKTSIECNEVSLAVSLQFLFSIMFVWLFCRANGNIKFLTKGDNNSVDDRGLYAPGQLWLERKDVVGRARG